MIRRYLTGDHFHGGGARFPAVAGFDSQVLHFAARRAVPHHGRESRLAERLGVWIARQIDDDVPMPLD